MIFKLIIFFAIMALSLFGGESAFCYSQAECSEAFKKSKDPIFAGIYQQCLSQPSQTPASPTAPSRGGAQKRAPTQPQKNQPDPKTNYRDPVTTCKGICSGTTGDCYRECLKNNYGIESSPNSGTASTPEDEKIGNEFCISQINEALRKCEDETFNSSASCDDERDPDLLKTQQAANAISQTMSASVQTACSNMGNLSNAANIALSSFQQKCEGAIGRCTSACRSAQQLILNKKDCLGSGGPGSFVAVDIPPEAVMATADYQSASKTLQSCEGLEMKSKGAGQLMNHSMQAMTQAMNCQSLTNGTGVATPPPALCAANPKMPGCAHAGPVDCTKPEMSTNKVCICSRNPGDPQCSTMQKPSGGMAGGGIDSSSRLPSNGSNDFGDIPNTPPISQGKPNNSGGESDVDGRQGGGNPVGSGGSDSGGPGGRSAAGGAAAEDPQAINAGFFGGGSQGAFGGVRSAAGTDEGMSDYSSTAANGGPDLNKFLPNGVYDPRKAMLGMTGPDGITGPNSNIWSKIQNRYQSIRSTLMP